MSDINKIVAAILTAGRVPHMSKDGTPRPMSDWLAEYEAWVETLNGRESEVAREVPSQWTLISSDG
jgi:hypothetical protein